MVLSSRTWSVHKVAVQHKTCFHLYVRVCLCVRVCVCKCVLRGLLLLLLPWSWHWCEYPEGDVTASAAACTQRSPVSIETCQTAKQSAVQLCLRVEGVVFWGGWRSYTISTAPPATNYRLRSNDSICINWFISQRNRAVSILWSNCCRYVDVHDRTVIV